MKEMENFILIIGKERKNKMNKEKTIKIYIEGGCLLDVTNLPPDYTYELIDYDNEETTNRKDVERKKENE